MDQITIAGQTHAVVNLPGRPAAMLDRSVAQLYEVSTKQVNQARTRNPEKFPHDFAYQLTNDETRALSKVTDCDLIADGHFTYSPWCYTWEGCNMLATILKSDIATQRAIQIIKGFTRIEQAAKISAVTMPVPLTTQAKIIIQDGLDIGALFNVPKHLAEAEAIKQAKQMTGLDYTPLLLASPAQNLIEDKDQALEPAEIGRRLGMNGSLQKIGRAVNRFLAGIGWQERVNGYWEAIGDGKKYSTTHHWVNGAKSGYNLKWRIGAVKKVYAKYGLFVEQA